MPALNLHTLLDRFRPAPPPGQPGPVGIPTQTPRTAVDELAPLFLLVDAIDADCSRIRAGADLRARQIVDDATVRAARIAADTTARAKEARDVETRAVRGTAHEHVAALLAAAQRDADEIKRRESAALAQRVESAVNLVRAIGGEPAKRPR